MDIRMEKILVTGAAGFIGFHLCSRLLKEGLKVTGIDNMNSYYDVGLKEARLSLLLPDGNFTFHRTDKDEMEKMRWKRFLEMRGST